VSSFLVDGMSVPWASSSPSWSISADASADALGRGGLGMVVRAAGAEASDVPPAAQRSFTPPLDLSAADELRLWVRSTRAADGSPTQPFYLALEATASPSGPGTTWRRFLPVPQPGAWTLQRLALDDMPAGFRKAVAALRIRSLDAATTFEAAFDELIAVRPEPLADVDAALLARFHERFEANGQPALVPAVIDLPEHPGDRTPPLILITPWSVLPLDRRAGGGDAVDNYTDAGAFARPTPRSIQLDFQLDVFAADRTQKAMVLDRMLASILSEPQLVAANVPLQMIPIEPSKEETAQLVPGRTPVFVRVISDIESGPRRLLELAVPFVLAGPADGRETAELTAI
jgi:hypothetical protein